MFLVLSVLALALPLGFYVLRRKCIWWSIVPAVLLNFLLDWQDFLYYESRPIFLCFVLAQVALMVLVILLLRFFGSKQKTSGRNASGG